MITLSNYHVDQMIYNGKSSIVYRGRQKSDNRPVIIKMLKDDYPSPATIARFQREYEVSYALNPSPNPAQALADVSATYAFEHDHRARFIVFEDFGGQSLKELGIPGNLNLVEFLELAIGMVDILGQILQKHVIHKDVNPSNIVWNRDNNQIKFIDFGISTMLSREIAAFRNPNVLEGTLAYISPEQTGRMNRAIDYRTDFYSLGVTLYELLTGKLPFESSDFMALIHAQIAKQPAPPIELLSPPSPAKMPILQAVSDIIIKLMAKNAEARYQSAYGIKRDLQALLDAAKSETLPEALASGSFALGARDTSDQFQISQKLYGREAEVDTLLAAFERVASGGSADKETPQSKIENRKSKIEMMLVAGYAGIGKSVLVQEVYKPITAQQGYFVSGKFDQFQRDIPYTSLIQAFRSLMQQLLTESSEQLAAWREKLSRALGTNGQVIVEVIPELAMIIGEQAPVSELPPAEAQNRFNFVLQNFIKVFTQPEHPLVIFLDDLQWADGASLNLIKLLMTAPDSQYLYLLGAYRDNEVNDAHPLMLTLDTIKKAGARVHQITLPPLDLSHITELIADTINSAPEQACPERSRRIKALAELVLTKTDGNPFFINEFLKSLHQQDLINFNYEQGAWAWDLQAIQNQKMTDNVVELMANKIEQLPLPTQAVLKLAACIGNQFDLETLAIVSEKSPRETAADLWAGIAAGFILPLSEDYQLAALDVENLFSEVTVEYEFAHDRIQQAVYALIPDADRAKTHTKIGQLLLMNMTDDEKALRIFDLVNHLNKGQPLIESQAERDNLAGYNLMAGRKAKASAAYGPAHTYFRKGLELLGDNSWGRNYELTLDLFTEAIETASITGDHEAMESWSEQVFVQAKTSLAKAVIYDIKALSYMGQGKLSESIQTTLEALDILGIDIPENRTEEEIGARLVATFALWQGKEIADFANLPEMTDPEKRLALQIISSVFSGTYTAAPDLVPIFAFTMTELSLKHGNAPASTFGYAAYALILCGMVGDYDSGYQFGQMALNLANKLNAPLFKSRVNFYMGIFINHWKRHLRESLPLALEAYQIGLEAGDLANAMLSAMLYSHHAYLAGEELTQLAETFEKYMPPMAQANQDFALIYQKIWGEPVFGLTGKAENIGLPEYEGYYSQITPVMYEQQFFPAIWSIKLNQGILAYVFQEYEFALEILTEAEKYVANAVGAITGPTFYFYKTLLLLALYPNMAEAEKESALETVTATQEKIKTWAEHAPMNFQHKHDLIAAEKARVLGQREAIDLYEAAIRGAQENDYIQEQALAYELAARFYLARDMEKIGQTYLREAHYHYQQWGAAVKVKDLERRYPQLLAQIGAGTIATQTTTATTTTGTKISSALDLTSVLKASQAISGEIVLSKLLANLMRIVIENAGAEKGYLILDKQGRRVIEAEGAVGQEAVTTLQSIPIEEGRVSTAIVNYVARARENVVLDDAVTAGEFTQDEYVVVNQPKSILCAPLINQGRLTGILYLENNLTTGAFTPDRLEMLNLLSSQAAISIENARLYDYQVTLTNSYSRFVPSEYLGFLQKESITEVNLGDHVSKTMAIMFSDIRSFTAISETMSSQENFNFVNAYLKRVSPKIRDNHGFIVKYLGDGMMAVFPDGADDALKAGVEKMQTVGQYNAHRIQDGWQPIEVGMGIHAGPMMVGMVGETSRMQGDAFSDDVNLTARLESLTRFYGAMLVISEEMRNQLSNPEQCQMRFLDRVIVQGRTEPILIYEVLDGLPEQEAALKQQTLPDFEGGWQQYKQGEFAEAKERFEAVLAVDPSDRAAALYLERIETLLQRGAPEDWDGVWSLTEK